MWYRKNVGQKERWGRLLAGCWPAQSWRYAD